MKIKALIVENNPVLLKAVSAIVEKEGCIVESAETGLEALEIVDVFCPDIIFTDLVMPMVGGEQLCRILRNSKKHEGVFIVVLSAIFLEDRERILREVQCDVCIAKGNLQSIRLHVLEALQTYNNLNVRKSTRTLKAAHIPYGLEPREMTTELLMEKRHFSQIVKNLEEGIIELNHQGKVMAANTSALNILSCREEEIIGVTLSEAIDWGKFKKAIRQWTERQLIALGMGKYDIFEDAPLFFGGRIVTASFVPIMEAGSIFGLCILRDISRQYKTEKYHKELDNALKLVKKMEAMSCMAGGFAHDFNNLLTVICGNLDVVTLHGENQSINDRQKLLYQARKAALVAVDLTRQISCFSNFGIMSREQVKVEALVQKTVDQFFQSEQDRYNVKVNNTNSLVHVDPKELSQAIVNVLQNAVESSSGQKVEIITGEDEFVAPRLMAGQYVPAGKYVRIDISDSGKGICPEQLFKIFDPYYSTKERGSSKGMGLGLTVVYAILRNHGGYVVVTSKINVGTTVTLFLPAQLTEKNISYKEAIPAERRFVLFIEPEKSMCEIGRLMLDYLGFSVRTAADRTGAVNELKKIIIDRLLPRPLVILDLSSKNGESAVETCRLLHEIDPELEVIAMSGTVLDPVMENCRDYGFINTLTKPFSMDSLKHVTNTVLHI